jgi:hypothetical protein
MYHQILVSVLWVRPAAAPSVSPHAMTISYWIETVIATLVA